MIISPINPGALSKGEKFAILFVVLAAVFAVYCYQEYIIGLAVETVQGIKTEAKKRSEPCSDCEEKKKVPPNDKPV